MRHTPGPWKIEKPNYGVTGRWIEAKAPTPYGSDYVAMICGDGNFKNEVEANARLVRAAPEMLEELNNALNWMIRGSADYERVIALIAKIEGK